MKSFLNVCVTFLFALILSVSVFAETDYEKVNNIYARAVTCGEQGSFDGFPLPSDSIMLCDESEKPTTEGAKITSFLVNKNATYVRTFANSTADRLDVKYSLTGENINTDIKDVSATSGIRITGSIALGVYVASSPQEITQGLATFEITARGDDSQYFCKVNVPFDTPTMIYADMTDVPEDVNIRDITLSLVKSNELGSITSVISTMPVSTESESFDFQKSGDLMWMSVIKGNVEISDKDMLLHTDTDNVIIQAVPKSAQIIDEDTLNRAYCSVGCTDGNGVISISAEGSSTISAQHSISPDGGYAMIRFSHMAGNEITFDFRSGSQNIITLDHFNFHPTTEIDSFTATSLTNLTYSNGKLFAEGKLSGTIVSTYPKDDLGLYMISPASGTSELIQKVNITSRFSFAADLTDKPHSACDNLFYIAIIDSSETELLRVSDPRFVSAASAKVPASSDFGLYGANPISVYESGASHIMVDVDISKLITAPSESNVTVSRGKYVFGINSDYLKKLDSDMNFYRSSGVSVYVRFICKNYIISSLDGDWLTYHGPHVNEVLLRSDHPEAFNMYMATVSFLCQRYPSISSIVISSGANAQMLTGIPSSDLYDYASEIAMISRLIYSAASEELQNITITVPIVEEDSDTVIPPEIFTSLLAERFSSIGSIPWSIMYFTDRPVPSTPAENILNSCRTNGTSGPSFTTVVWSQSIGDDIISAYKDFCKACSITSVKLVFLSVIESDEMLSRDDFSGLKKGMLSDAVFMDSSPVPFEKVYDGSINGVYPLWNFANSYSPEGWTAGYGISSLMSSAKNTSNTSGNRILRCITEGTCDSPAGIILCSPDSPINLSVSPLIEFVFSWDAGDDTQIVFVFANETSRAEFSFTDSEAYLSNGKYHAVCDLTDFSEVSSIGYVGVIIYSDSPVTFELSEVNALSRTYSKEEIAGRILSSDSTNEPSSAPPVKLVICSLAGIAIIIVSVKIVSSLGKRDTKHKEEMMALKASQKRRI